MRDAEVLYLAFPRLQRALIVDLRPGTLDDLFVLVTVLAFGALRQAAAIATLHPDQPPSLDPLIATWGGSTRAFMEQGVLPAILNRLPAEHTKEVMIAFEELRVAERGPRPTVTKPRTPVGE